MFILKDELHGSKQSYECIKKRSSAGINYFVRVFTSLVDCKLSKVYHIQFSTVFKKVPSLTKCSWGPIFGCKMCKEQLDPWVAIKKPSQA